MSHSHHRSIPYHTCPVPTPSPTISIFTHCTLSDIPFQHLTSYPAVSDSISTFKSNPFGAKALDISNTGYEKFVSPFVPYAKRPYGYVAPYVAKADSLASDGLSKVDNTFPIVKQDTEKIKGTVLDYAYFPFRIVGDGKNYLLDTYTGEYKKCGGDGYVAGGKAMITTGLVVTSDTLAWLGSFLGQKKEEGSDYAAKKYGQASDFAHDKSGAAMNFANEKSGAAMNFASEKAQQTKDFAYQKKEEAKDAASQAKETAEQKGNEYKSTAEQKGNEYKSTAEQKGSEAKGTAEQKGSEAKGTAEKKGSEAKQTAKDKSGK